MLSQIKPLFRSLIEGLHQLLISGSVDPFLKDLDTGVDSGAYYTASM